MSFFEPPEPPAEPPAAPREPPEWRSPPDNVLPASLPLVLPLVRTDEVAFWLDGFLAYPSGFSFALELVRRRDPDEPGADPFLARPRAPVSPDALLFGLQFSDGSAATNLARPWELPDDARPEAPVLAPHRGSGTVRRRSLRYWVWPLPPAGPLAFVCSWTARGIAETRIETDAGPLLAAAREAMVLWPGRRGGGGAWVGSYRVG